MFSVVLKIYRSVLKTKAMTQSIGKDQDDDSARSKGTVASKSSSLGKKSGGQLMKMIRQPVGFVILTFCATIPWWVWRLDGMVKGKVMPAGEMVKWVDCILNNFDGDDSTWRRVCGVHPPNRSSPFLTALSNGGLFAVAVLTSTIYMMSPSLWTLWYETLYFWVYRKKPMKTGVSGALGGVSAASSKPGKLSAVADIKKVHPEELVEGQVEQPGVGVKEGTGGKIESYLVKHKRKSSDGVSDKEVLEKKGPF